MPSILKKKSFFYSTRRIYGIPSWSDNSYEIEQKILYLLRLWCKISVVASQGTLHLEKREYSVGSELNQYQPLMHYGCTVALGNVSAVARKLYIPYIP